ncbi:phosphodiesterase, partial [Myxococcota bacterium]|nr:phosphodiesterase [Myxococcota bacterium]
LLYEEIDKLFEGFVRASVTAIESRDPTTSGHSERVADLTVGLAETMEHVKTGPYADLKMGTDDLRQIRYASLLHDFGKVGVRENVLTKANKLYGEELGAIEARFQAAMAQKESDYLLQVIHNLQNGGKDIPTDLQKHLADHRIELNDFLDFIRACNRPTVLDSSGFERLDDVAKMTLLGPDGNPEPLLSGPELHRLSIPRGSLDASEREEIESHVSHTYRFLEQIPWTRDLRNVPNIAYAHHEKLDGTGYPRNLSAEDIPVQSRMMAIADIYDALTASDRPYKKAMPHAKALDILGMDAGHGKIDSDLLKIFIDAKIFERVMKG